MRGTTLLFLAYVGVLSAAITCASASVSTEDSDAGAPAVERFIDAGVWSPPPGEPVGADTAAGESADPPGKAVGKQPAQYTTHVLPDGSAH